MFRWISLLAFLAVYPLRSIAPLSVGVLAYMLPRSGFSLRSLFTGSPIQVLLLLYSIIEALFFLWFLLIRSTGAPLILLNFDPVIAKHRPLLHYVVTSTINLFSEAILIFRHFHRRQQGFLKYWIRHGDDNDLDPVIFLHGVGIGLATYLPFIHEISPERTLILVELPHVSMKLTVKPVPSMKQIVVSIEQLLNRLGFDGGLWLGHSLGTCVIAAAIQIKPDLVKNVILIDPVCLMLWEPRVVKNFVYRRPVTPRQRIQNFHVSKELNISYYFHRHFCWRECVLFPDQLPSGAVVFVCEYDDFCNHDRIISYLAAHKIQVHTFSNHSHGGWIIAKDSRKSIVSAIQKFK